MGRYTAADTAFKAARFAFGQNVFGDFENSVGVNVFPRQAERAAHINPAQNYAMYAFYGLAVQHGLKVFMARFRFYIDKEFYIVAVFLGEGQIGGIDEFA